MSWRNLIWMSILLALAVLALVHFNSQPPYVPPQDPAITDLAGGIRAYKLIQQEAYRPPPPWEAARSAIDGLARGLDEFSLYVPPDKADAFDRHVDGTLEETGLRIDDTGSALVTVGCVEGSPAAKAGVPAGLEIAAIDLTEAEYLTLAQARDMLAQRGRKITLRLRGPGGKELSYTLSAERFETPTVTGLVRSADGKWDYCLDKKAGLYYLRIEQFVGRTPDELARAFAECDNARGLVLDLRDNPGGTLASAVEVADCFLTEGLIVTTYSRHGEKPYFAKAEGTWPALPLVVLIDEQTASAAEIVAGALAVHGRAVLVGQNTFGKWCVQRPIDLGHGLGRLSITTAEYFLPNSPLAVAATSPAAPPEPMRVIAAAAAAHCALSAVTGSGGDFGCSALMAGANATSCTPAALTPLPPAPPATRRMGVPPDVAVRIPARSTAVLERLRVQSIVMPPPTATGPARATSPQQIKGQMLRLDQQLSLAVEMLRESRVTTPTTQKTATAPAATTQVNHAQHVKDAQTR